MSARLVTIAEAVKTYINGLTLSPATTAYRVYDPQRSLVEIGQRLILVVPKSRETAGLKRRGTQDTIQIDVAIMDQLSGDPSQSAGTTSADTLMALVETIFDAFTLGQTCSTGHLVGKQHSLLYDPARIREDHAFVSVITLTFIHL